MTLLGIDIGTSGVKAAVFTEHGDQLAVASAAYNSLSSGKRTELVPDKLWNAVRDAVREVVREALRRDIRAISISSHGETFIPVDRRGHALCAFISNVDQTANDEAFDLANRVGKTRICSITGLPIHGMYTVPKILWLRRNRPEIYREAAKFLCIEDYLFQRIGVGAFISHSLASRTFGFDIRNRVWSDEILRACNLNPGNFATPVPSGIPLGVAPIDVADDFDLPRDAVWVSGGHDQACSSLGAGGLAGNVAVDGTGTFECLTLSCTDVAQASMKAESGFPVEAHVSPQHYLTLAYVPGGIVPSWMLSRVLTYPSAADTEHPTFDSILPGIPKEPTGILVFPYLFGTGTPWFDSEAKGMICGLTENTTAQSLFQACLEGVSFEMRWNIEQLKGCGESIQTIHAVGGGTRSRAWLQLKADIFGRSVISVKGESSCAGAAICAGMGINLFSSWSEASDAFVRPSETFSPRPAVSGEYQRCFNRYKELAGRIFNFHSRIPADGHPARRSHE